MFGLGVDIGKHVDPGAIMGVRLVPRLIRPPEMPTPDYTVPDRGKIIHEYQGIHIERVDIGTNYSILEDRVCQIMATPTLLHESRLLVDVGNVGDAVFERWRDVHALAPIGIRIITSAQGVNVTRTEYGFAVPKIDLISSLMHVFSTRRLRFPLDKQWPEETRPLKNALIRELQNFKIDFTEKRNPTLEGRNSVHDDLIMALAMPVWYLEHAFREHFQEGFQRPEEKDRRDDWDPIWDAIDS